MFSRSSVRRNCVARITNFDSLNTPISFFSPPKLIPVFPPTEASTIESSVVGMLMKSMPRLKADAAKPPRSVTMPPPRLMRHEWRVAPMRCSSLHTWLMDSRFLCVSPALMTIRLDLRRQKKSLMSGQHKRSVFSSVSTKILSCSHSEIAVASSSLMFLEIIILCSITL